MSNREKQRNMRWSRMLSLKMKIKMKYEKMNQVKDIFGSVLIGMVL